MPGDSGTLKSIATFEIPANLCAEATDVKYRLANTPISVAMARTIAAALAERGHRVSKVCPGSGGGAGFYCRLHRACEITVFLGVDRREGDAVHFHLMTWQSASLIGQVLGRRAKTPDCDKRWSTLCQAINDVLKSTGEGTSVVWRTREEDDREPQ